MRIGKIKELTYIRVIATLLVLIGHCTSLNYGVEPNLHVFDCSSVKKVPFLLNYLREFIYSFHMPLFVFLSGILFLYSYKHMNIKEFVYKKFKRLMFPYFIVAILLFIPVRLCIGYYTNINIIDIFINDIILGKDINYLWYLMMLFELNVCFYLISAKKCFKCFEKNSKLAFLLLLSISIVSQKIEYLPFQLHKLLQLSLWFYLGILFQKYDWLSKFKGIKNKKKLIVLLTVVQLIGVYYLKISSHNLFVFSNILVKLTRVMLTYFMYFNGIVMSVFLSICLSLKNGESNYIDRNSFEIYLYHVPIGTLFSYIVQICFSGKIKFEIIYLLLVLLKLFVSFLGSIMLIKLKGVFSK